MGASEIVKYSQNLAVESRNADKCAFREARPAESLSDSSSVLSASTDQLAEMCQSCRSVGSRVPSKTVHFSP